MPDVVAPLSAAEYDEQWRVAEDFVRYHPGSRHRRRLALSLVSDLPFSTYLEVGCGPADFLRALAGRRAAMGEVATGFWGADLSDDVIKRNSERWPQHHFETLNVENERLDRKFDLVGCQEVIEHLACREDAFANLSSMLNSGGHLLITCPTGKVFETERHFGHTTHPDAAEIRRHADANDLEVVELINWGFPSYRLLKIATNLNSKRAIETFASGRYGFFQKRVCDALYLANFCNLRSPWGVQLFALLRKR